MTHCNIELPESLNEFTLKRLDFDLDHAISSSCRVIVLRGKDDIFCKGLDLESLVAHAKNQDFKLVDAYIELVLKLYTIDKITICYVNGETFGGGMGIASACDYIIANENAKFALPEAFFGILPGIVMPLIATRVNITQLKKHALLAKSFSAHEALNINLIDSICQDEEKELHKLIKDFTRCHKDSITAIKKMTCMLSLKELKRDIRIGADTLMERLKHEDVISTIENFTKYGIIDRHD